ncbi:MAG: hypothetical protein GC161_11995 [Planctomycetaceae bacterium]|nr:hypothetical protein [Planctomycetaceae bacterium]
MKRVDCFGRWLAAWALLLGTPAFAVRVGASEHNGVAFSLGLYLREAGPALVAVLLPALGAAWLATGAAGVAAGIARLGGDRAPLRAALAARALAAAARGALGAGLVLALAAPILLGAALRGADGGGDLPPPAFVARGVYAGMLPPLWALLAGRCWLGAHAARAATDAGERHGRTLRGWGELAVPLLVVVLAALLLLSTLYTQPAQPR